MNNIYRRVKLVGKVIVIVTTVLYLAAYGLFKRLWR